MNTNLEDITKSIQKKLGKEDSAKIADDLATIITIKSNYDKQNKENNETIEKLKGEKETLIQANGSLLQQVSMGKEEDINPNKEKEEPKKPFDFRSAFDEKGNFKKTM